MLNISFHHFAPFSSRAGIAAPLRSAAPLGAANARTSQKRRRLCRPPAANKLNSSRRTVTVAAFRFPRPSGAPIVPLPRKRLAVSVTDGASPFSAPRKVFSARRRIAPQRAREAPLVGAHVAAENGFESISCRARHETLRGFLLLLFVNVHIQRVERVGEAADALDEAAGHCFFPVEHAADVRGEVLRVHHQAQKLVAPDA